MTKKDMTKAIAENLDLPLLTVHDAVQQVFDASSRFWLSRVASNSATSAFCRSRNERRGGDESPNRRGS